MLGRVLLDMTAEVGSDYSEFIRPLSYNIVRDTGSRNIKKNVNH